MTKKYETLPMPIVYITLSLNPKKMHATLRSHMWFAKINENCSFFSNQRLLESTCLHEE